MRIHDAAPLIAVVSEVSTESPGWRAGLTTNSNQPSDDTKDYIVAMVCKRGIGGRPRKGRGHRRPAFPRFDATTHDPLRGRHQKLWGRSSSWNRKMVAHRRHAAEL